MSAEDSPPSSDHCPTFDQLRAFQRGQLEAPALESVGRHLQSCERCALLFLSVSDAASAAHAAAGPAEAANAAAAVAADASTSRSGIELTTRRGTEPLASDAATVSLSAEAPTAIGRYTILRVLGRGGFGVVYLARDAELDRLVAIKTPHAERIKRASDLDDYRREARLHAGIDHTHVVPIYDVGNAEGAPFFVVSKFVPGIDLSGRLHEGLPAHRTLAEWIATLAEALDHVHRQGVIHRDVKPRNIMIDPAGRAYLMDFGLAKQVAPHDRAGPIVGTPAYMAPEQARGEPLDGRCDVYALGMALYEALTGRRPFRGEPTSIMQQVLNTEPPLPRSVNKSIPRDLEAICVKALAKDRARRYLTAGELAEDLRCWLRGEPLRLARRVGPVERAWSWTKRHRAVAALSVVAAAALASAAFAYRQRQGDAVDTYAATVHTTPAGAEVHYFPLNPATGGFGPKSDKRAPAGAVVQLQAGYYLVVAVLPDGRFHEVIRFVPPDGRMPDPWRHHRSEMRGGVVHLRPIEIPANDTTPEMSLVPGVRSFSVLSDGNIALPGGSRGIASFFLDVKEVSVAEFTAVMTGFRLPPAAPVPPPDWPVTNVSWDEAVAYAELTGKRLLDEFEFLWVASEFGKVKPLDKRALTSWALAASGEPASDRIDVPGGLPVHGMRSNALEWTGSWAWTPAGAASLISPMNRVVCGGPEGALSGSLSNNTTEWSVYERTFLARPQKHAGLGFRCARSAKPRVEPATFGMTGP